MNTPDKFMNRTITSFADCTETRFGRLMKPSREPASNCADPLRIILSALQNPDRLGHSVDMFKVVETHISYVLLTGPYAYKFKKAIKLPFLDFSTLEKRKHYCEEELRLNRRLAPELYLEVVAIRGTETAPEVNGRGPIIEYAVKMRQFPHQDQLDRLVARHELEATHVRRLAVDIAGFHQRIAVADANSGFGSSEQLHADVMANFESLRSIPETVAERAIIEAIHGWSARSLVERGIHFRQRRRGGFIRECHGDLHLGNIALFGGKPVVFDCIEFNEQFRWIDVMSEVAFLIMDLNFRRRADLANSFLNAYLECTGDYAGLPVLRHYLVYRAVVRAKVAAIRLRQLTAGDDAYEATLRDLVDHLELAARSTEATNVPSIVITHGLSGSGKSRLTDPLARVTGAIRIRSDVERKRLSTKQIVVTNPPVSKPVLYSPEATDRTYRRLADLTRTVVRSGYPAIVDATFLSHAERERFRKLARQLKVPFKILALEAPAAVLERRVSERHVRQRDASDATLAVLEDQRRTMEPLRDDERAFAVFVDTSRHMGVDTIASLLAETSESDNRTHYMT